MSTEVALNNDNTFISSGEMDSSVLEQSPKSSIRTLQILSHTSPSACIEVANAYLNGTREDVFTSVREAKKYYLQCKSLLELRRCDVSNDESLKKHLSLQEKTIYDVLKDKFEDSTSIPPALKLKLHQFIEEYVSTDTVYTAYGLLNPIRIGTTSALTGYTALLSIPVFGPMAIIALSNLGVIYHTISLLIDGSVILKNVINAGLYSPLGKSAWLEMKKSYFATINTENERGESRGYRIRNSLTWWPILVTILITSIAKLALDKSCPLAGLGLAIFANLLTGIGFGCDISLVAKIGNSAVKKLEDEQTMLNRELFRLNTEINALNLETFVTYKDGLNQLINLNLDNTQTLKKIHRILQECPHTTDEGLKTILEKDRNIIKQRLALIKKELPHVTRKADLENAMVKVTLWGFGISVVGGSLMLAAPLLGPAGLPMFAAGLFLSAIGTTLLIGSLFSSVAVLVWDRLKKRDSLAQTPEPKSSDHSLTNNGAITNNSGIDPSDNNDQLSLSNSNENLLNSTTNENDSEDTSTLASKDTSTLVNETPADSVEITLVEKTLKLSELSNLTLFKNPSNLRKTQQTVVPSSYCVAAA